MALYNIYAGMTGGFNNVDYRGTWDFDTLEEAEEVAYEFAVEEYESYEGRYGVLCWADCRDELEKEGYDYTDKDVDDFYDEEMHRWIDYYAVLASEDPKHPLD